MNPPNSRSRAFDEQWKLVVTFSRQHEARVHPFGGCDSAGRHLRLGACLGGLLFKSIGLRNGAVLSGDNAFQFQIEITQRPLL